VVIAALTRPIFGWLSSSGTVRSSLPVAVHGVAE
jgi:hypothetical protein